MGTGKMYKRNKKIYGMGVNDADYRTQIREIQEDGTKKIIFLCPFYDRWVGVLKRCYSLKSSKRSPSYSECTVCEEWLTFSNFKDWMERQDWRGKALDKDILAEGNKEYSPECCMFVDPTVNGFTVLRGADRGVWPLGVSLVKARGKYMTRCNTGDTRTPSKVFNTPMEAHKAYQIAKRERAIYLQSQQTDSRVIGGLQRIIDKLQYDYDNNLETKTL